jgi:hypothetical protein
MIARFQPSDAQPHDLPDTLVPDPQVAREFGITSMTLWRWDHDPSLNFPPPTYIRKRKFRSRKALEKYKQRLWRGTAA